MASLNVTLTGKDQLSPVIRGAQNTMNNFKQDAKTGFGLAAGVNITNLATQAFGFLTSQMMQALAAARDLQEQQTKVNFVFKDAANAVNVFASGAATSFGISQRAALEAMGTIGNLLEAIGESPQRASEMSVALTRLAADLSSFNNVASSEVLRALNAALVGEAEPARRLGVNISMARVEAKALAMGLADTKTAITDADKVTARYAIIMEDTKNAQGDFARTSMNLANQQRMLDAQIENLSAHMGQLVQGPATLLVGVFNDILKSLAGPTGVNAEIIRLYDLIANPPNPGGNLDKYGQYVADIAEALKDPAFKPGPYQTEPWWQKYFSADTAVQLKRNGVEMTTFGTIVGRVIKEMDLKTTSVAGGFDPAEEAVAYRRGLNIFMGLVAQTTDMKYSIINAWQGLGDTVQGTFASAFTAPNVKAAGAQVGDWVDTYVQTVYGSGKRYTMKQAIARARQDQKDLAAAIYGQPNATTMAQVTARARQQRIDIANVLYGSSGPSMSQVIARGQQSQKQLAQAVFGGAGWAEYGMRLRAAQRARQEQLLSDQERFNKRLAADQAATAAQAIIASTKQKVYEAGVKMAESERQGYLDAIGSPGWAQYSVLIAQGAVQRTADAIQSAWATYGGRGWTMYNYRVAQFQSASAAQAAKDEASNYARWLRYAAAHDFWNAGQLAGEKFVRGFGTSFRDQMKAFKQDVRDMAMDIQWELNHPKAEGQYITWLQAKLKATNRQARRARREGNQQALEDARALRRELKLELERIGALDTSIGIFVDASLLGGGKKDTRKIRAAGGPVYAGQSYVVGERGPEILQMGAANGRVVANHQIGGAPIIVNIDGQRLFEIVNNRLGRTMSMGG